MLSEVHSPQPTFSMSRGSLKTATSTAALALFMSVSAIAAQAADLDTTPIAEDVSQSFLDRFFNAFKDGKIIADTRTRYEFADQSTFVENANALTFRGRFGFETAEFKGFKLLAEGDFTQDLGLDNFNSTTNGLTQFPIIADPDSQRLNRLQLTYQGIIPDTKFIAGRQRIKLDNDRFVGNVGFRQNEQTFDALRVQNTSIDNLTLDYTFLWQVNRINGSDSPVGTADGNSHLINASYKLPFGKLTGYGYFIDVDDFVPGLSNQTFGVRFAGKHKFEPGFTLGLEAEYANQSEFADNPVDRNTDYYTAIGSIGYKGFTLKGGIETLGSDNGIAGFATPFATLHKFNGHADVFLATPAAGLRDLNIGLQYKIKDLPFFGETRIAARYHDFNTDVGNLDIGSEFDIGIYTKPHKNITASIEYADFSTASNTTGPSGTDLRRLFVTLGVKL